MAGTLALQLYGCVLAYCFLYLCVKTKYAGTPLYLLLCSFFTALSLSFFAFGYDFTPDLVTAAMETNTTEASAFFTLASASGFCGLMLVSWGILYAFRKLCGSHENASRRWHIGTYGTALIVMGATYMLPSLIFFWIPWSSKNVPEYVVRHLAGDEIRWNPFFHIPNYRAPYESFSNHYRKPFSNLATLNTGLKDYLTPQQITDSATAPSTEIPPHKDFICVLAVGESIRADHWGINGYARNTTPKLGNVRNLFNLSRMFSFGASTDPSFRSILTGQLTNNQTAFRTSFLSILKKHGYTCSYITENADDMTTTRRNRHIIGDYIDTRLSLSGSISDVSAAWRKALPSSGKHCIILQNGTGHYPYPHDKEFSIFTDGKGDSRVLVNNYDNCVLAMDSLYESVIASLADKNAVLIYCSDHGEMLGEDGKWHHGDENEPILHRVAAFVWFSDTFIANNRELVEGIARQKDIPLAQGQLYATILRLCHISTEASLEIGDIVTDSLLSHPENNLPETIKNEILEYKK